MSDPGYGSVFGRGSAISPVGFLVCLILAVVATVLVCVFVLPEKRRARLPKFFAKLHDIVNFKVLIIETLLKILYILNSCTVIFTGLYILFADSALRGLVVLVIGLIVVRVCYELTMLLVIGVNNLTRINRKLTLGPPRLSAPSAQTSAATAETEPVPPEQETAPETASVQEREAPDAGEPVLRYCIRCGTRFDITRGICPNCGKRVFYPPEDTEP